MDYLDVFKYGSIKVLHYLRESRKQLAKTYFYTGILMFLHKQNFKRT